MWEDTEIACEECGADSAEEDCFYCGEHLCEGCYNAHDCSPDED